MSVQGRHPATKNIMRWFSADHLAPGLVRETAEACGDLAADMVDTLPDGSELSAGLRKLLEAKDCFVRAALSGK